MVVVRNSGYEFRITANLEYLIPSTGDGGCFTALSITSANEANVFPEPTGPINPRTKESSCKNFHTVGLSEKSKLNPVKASGFTLPRRLDLSVALSALAIITLRRKNNNPDLALFALSRQLQHHLAAMVANNLLATLIHIASRILATILTLNRISKKPHKLTITYIDYV
jgi:hypothetical protein